MTTDFPPLCTKENFCNNSFMDLWQNLAPFSVNTFYNLKPYSFTINWSNTVIFFLFLCFIDSSQVYLLKPWKCHNKKWISLFSLLIRCVYARCDPHLLFVKYNFKLCFRDFLLIRYYILFGLTFRKFKCILGMYISPTNTNLFLMSIGFITLQLF